jgi:hypothetical protein
MPAPTFPRGIKSIYRVIDAKGKETLYIPETPSAVSIPWSVEAVAMLESHFTADTKFFIRDERRARRYSCQKEWWLTMDAVTLLESAIRGRDMRLA